MKAFGVTDKGIVRTCNEDSYRFALDESAGSAILVLCDGMGGEKSGEVASALAADSFLEYSQKYLSLPEPLPCVQTARESAAYANLLVYDRAYRDDACHGMGTTLVAAVIRGDDAVVVNVGDSRCYWLAEGQIQQVTRDHSWVQDLVDQGVITSGEARSHPRRNLITRAVGLQRRIRTDIFRLDLREGDSLLLCSDGLSNLVTEYELEQILLSEPDGNAVCESLLRTALQRGAPDNVTILLLQR